MHSLSAALGLLAFGLAAVGFGAALCAVFYEDCIEYGPGKPWQYILAPVGVVLILLGVMVIYHTTRVFLL